MSTIANISVAAGFMSGLGIALASLLAFANRKLFVQEDPRIDEVESMLPSTNCGACGTPGCRAFAEALIEEKVTPGQCTVNAVEQNKAIAKFLGVDLGQQEKRVARLACAGGNNVARQHARYDGLDTCRAAALVGSGGKGCAWGCLGLADCADVCDFDAITMNKQGLPEVIAEKCTACGDCIDICPKGLFSLEPVSHHLWVACKNIDNADDAENDCAVACTACERCAMDSPEGLIRIENNLAVIDYQHNNLASEFAIQRCPTGAIVWVDDDQKVRKGAKAKKVIRRGALPLTKAAAQ